MNENTDKQLEELVDKVMEKSTLETPSFNFTANVMAQVIAIEQRAITAYKPLIPKWIWAIIFSVVIGFVAYLWFTVQPGTTSWIPSMDFEFLSNNRISKGISGITFSKTTTYAILLLAVMVFIQIPILKNYFDKRMDI
jgi:hypothetical protein